MGAEISKLQDGVTESLSCCGMRNSPQPPPGSLSMADYSGSSRGAGNSSRSNEPRQQEFKGPVRVGKYGPGVALPSRIFQTIFACRFAISACSSQHFSTSSRTMTTPLFVARLHRHTDTDTDTDTDTHTRRNRVRGATGLEICC